MRSAFFGGDFQNGKGPHRARANDPRRSRLVKKGGTTGYAVEDLGEKGTARAECIQGLTAELPSTVTGIFEPEAFADAQSQWGVAGASRGARGNKSG